MRLLEVETFGRGGLLHYAYNLSLALAERGHQLTLVTTAGYELEDRLELPPNVRLIKRIARLTQGPAASWPAPILAMARKIEALFDALAVAALARRLRPDLIHLHCTNPVALAYLALFRLLRIPVVATTHVVTPHEPIRFQQAVYGRIHRLCDLLIAHSQVDRSRLIEEFAVDSAKIQVIPHGEYGFFERHGAPPDRDAARAVLGLAPQDEVVLFFGYIREYKGLDLLLDAWPTVREARPDARLVIAGDPVQLEASRRVELERRATELGAIHRFAYIPFSQVPAYFTGADALVMPYRSISQSGVLYLALSLGLPVVATSVGGLAETLCDGDSALLVPPESPAALSGALSRVLSEPELRRRLAEGGLAVARSHSWPKIAELTEESFAPLVSG